MKPAKLLTQNTPAPRLLRDLPPFADEEELPPRSPLSLHPDDPVFYMVRTKALDLLTSPNPDIRALRLFVRQALQIRRAAFNFWKSMNRPRKRKNQPAAQPSPWTCSELDQEIADALCARAEEAAKRCLSGYSPTAAKEFRALMSLLLLLRNIVGRETAFAPAHPQPVPGTHTAAPAPAPPKPAPTAQPPPKIAAPLLIPTNPSNYLSKAAA